MEHGSSQSQDQAHGGTHGAHGEHAAHPHIVPVATYIKVFVTLMVLWVLTSACAKIDLDKVFPGCGFAVCFTIALTKAVLIVLIFMHVKYSSKVTWVFATAAFLWLGLLFGFTFCDYMSRGKVVPDETPIRLVGPAPGVQEVSQPLNEMSGVTAPKP